MKKIIFELLHWTWCLPQTLLGLLLFIVYKYLIDKEAIRIKSKNRTILTLSKKFPGGVSLGKYMFAIDYNIRDSRQERIIKHEYGHVLQSLALGPLYLIIIGIPSISWAGLRRAGLFKKYSYYSFYPEVWADKLGKVKR